MRAEIVMEEKERTYPCLVLENETSDGSKPTVYLKPDKFTSVVVVVGHFAKMMKYGVGHVIDARDQAVRDERGLDEGEGIDEDLPLFGGKVELEN